MKKLAQIFQVSIYFHLFHYFWNSIDAKTRLSFLQRSQVGLTPITGSPDVLYVNTMDWHPSQAAQTYCIYSFKCLYGQAPNYLIDFITLKKQSRYSLRSNESIFLELPGIKTHPTLGDRAFQSAAPYLWNALPSAIRNMKTLDTFKTAVKTHFFNLAFK